MKRKLSLVVGTLFLGAALASCGKNKENNSQDISTTEKIDYTDWSMPEFHSTYVAKTYETMPTISIQAESNSFDFVTKPQTQPKNKYVEPWYESCTVNVTNGNTKELENVAAEVKVRGNWTTSYSKKPLRIKFSEKQSVLGMNDGKKAKNWVLLASYKDWSMLRDASGLYLSKLLSKNYSSDFQLVNVEINGEYWGVYLLAEQQQVNKNRISITEPEKDYSGTDIGYFMEFDGYYAEEENYFTIPYYEGQWDATALRDLNNKSLLESYFQSGYTIKSDITNDAQKTFIQSYMRNLWKICYEAVANQTYYEFNSDYSLKESTTIHNSYDAVKNIIDIESLVDTYILQELVCDPDIYWSSFYMDIDFGAEGDKKLRFEAPWDFDSTMGNKDFCADAHGMYAGKLGWDVNHEYQCANPWLMVFVRCDWFQKLVKQKWNMISEDNIFEKVYSYIDYCSNTYQRNFEKNYMKWNNIGRNDWLGKELVDAAAKCKTEKEAADYLKNWLTKRVSYLNTQWK